MKKFIILISVLFSLSISAEEISSFKLNGNAKNSINAAFDGRIIGNVYPAADRFGNPNGAMSFESEGYIQSDGMRNYNFGSNFSISLWVKMNLSDPKVKRTQYAILGNGNVADSTFTLYTSKFYINSHVSGSTTDWADVQYAGQVATDNEWVHVVVTSGDNGMFLYFNSAYANSNSRNITTTKVVNNPFIIGATRQPTTSIDWLFEGTIDDIKIYNHILSVSEIDDLYNDYEDGFSLELTNKKNITLVDKETTIPSAVLMSNNTLESADIITWSSLTFPNGNTIYKQVIKKYTLPAESERTITTRPIIYSWYPKGDYIFKYYLANENVEGGDIIYDHFTFTKE